MAKSIMQSEKRCYMCGSHQWLENHHVFGGAYRKKSERDGLTVYLCHWCHNEPPRGVHHNRQNMDWLRARGQEAWMRENNAGIDDFIMEYDRNYL